MADPAAAAPPTPKRPRGRPPNFTPAQRARVLALRASAAPPPTMESVARGLGLTVRQVERICANEAARKRALAGPAAPPPPPPPPRPAAAAVAAAAPPPPEPPPSVRRPSGVSRPGDAWRRDIRARQVELKKRIRRFREFLERHGPPSEAEVERLKREWAARKDADAGGAAP